jgi:hypothetical protein
MLEGAAKVVLAQLFRELGRIAASPAGPGARPHRVRPAAKLPWWQRLLAFLRGVA